MCVTRHPTTIIISLLLLNTMTRGATNKPLLPSTKPNSPTPASLSTPEPVYVDYLDKITDMEYVDGDSIDIYWTPSAENEPLLRLMYKGVLDEKSGEGGKLCETQFMSSPWKIVNQSVEFVSCQVYSYVLSHIEIALVPTVCNGNNLTNTNHCAVIDNVRPQHFRSVKTWEMRHFFRIPPKLAQHQSGYKYWFEFTLADDLSLVIHYEVTDLHYRLEEFVVSGGRNESDDKNWKVIFQGTEHSYVLKSINSAGIRKYRLFLSEDTVEPVVWSRASNIVEINFQHETTTTIPPTTVPTTPADPTKTSVVAKRRLTHAIVLTVLIIVAVMLLIFSYYFCYKHLGLCRRVNGGIPRPKLLIPISSQHDPSAPHHMDHHMRSPGDMEEAVDEATPLGREHLLARRLRQQLPLVRSDSKTQRATAGYLKLRNQMVFL